MQRDHAASHIGKRSGLSFPDQVVALPRLAAVALFCIPIEEA